MRKGFLALVVVLIFCFRVFAGTYLMNDTGQTVYGLQVMFSEPVIITAFGDALTTVNPTDEATQFTFSSGQVCTTGGQWFNWEPATANLVSHQWLPSSSIATSGISEATEHASIATPSKMTITNFAAEQPKLEQRIFDDELLRVTKDENRVYFDIENPDFSELAVHENVYEVDDFEDGISNLGAQWHQYTYQGDNPPMQRGRESGDFFLRVFPSDNIFTGLIHPISEFDASRFDQLVVNMEYEPNSYVRVIIDAINSSLGEDSFSTNNLEVSSRRDYVFPFSEMVSEESGESFSGIGMQYIKLFESFGPEGEWSIYSVQFRDSGQLVQAEDGRLSWSMKLEPGQSHMQLHLFADNESDELDIDVDQIPVAVEPLGPVAPEINDFYFTSHPATLMQGVTDRDKIFEMPLDGIPELGAVMGTDANGDSLEWSVESNHSAVDAYIQNDMLYIAATDPLWTGDTSVTVTLTDETGLEDRVNIPVVVFKTDRTRINSEGVKEYYIPWGVELDINRIVSVEEHMRQYDKEDLGLLDRTLRFSPWRIMEYLKDVTISGWANEIVTDGGFTQELMFGGVDVIFDDLLALGVNGIRLENNYYLNSLNGSTILPVYSRWNASPTKNPEEETYIINEAHRRGFNVIMTNWFGVDTASTGGVFYEACQAKPKDEEAFWGSHLNLTLESVMRWTSLGVEIMSICDSLDGIGDGSYSSRLLTEKSFINAINESKKITPGSVTAFTSTHHLLPNERILFSDIWDAADILIVSLNYDDKPYASSNDPSLGEVVASMKRYIDNYFQPFQRRFNKPFLPHENGCWSFDGAIKWGMYAEFREEKPWVVDISDMELYYRAHSIAYSDMDGYFGPGWYVYAINPYTAGLMNDRGPVPRLKIDGLIEELFTGSRTSHLIKIDGQSSDWTSNLVIAEDPIGDNASGDDITSLSAYEDESYLYLNVGYNNSPKGPLMIEFDMDSDGHGDYFLECNNFYTEYGTWKAFLSPQRWGNPVVGFADMEATSRSLELRIAKRFLGKYSSISVRLEDRSSNWSSVEDRTPYYELF